MTSEFSNILRLPRPDHSREDSDFVLLHVESSGRKQLDLKLIGTENETVFCVSLKHAKIADLKSKNSPCSAEDWEGILVWLFYGTVPDKDRLTEGVEAIAKVEKRASSLTVTVHKSIEGITQKLGTISLPATDDEEPSLYDWCGSLAEAKNNTTRELYTLQASLRDKDTQMKKIQYGLDELVRLKSAHEDALLEKFSLLLNEKKLKIRDQQRLLSASNVDPAKLKELEKRGGGEHSAGPSRKGKRKAGEQDDESEDGFENMVAEEEEAHDGAVGSEDDGRQTPQNDSTESEDSEDDGPTPPPSRKAASRNSEDIQSSATANEQEELPPRRELPFNGKAAAKAKPAPVVDGSDTESDDEL